MSLTKSDADLEKESFGDQPDIHSASEKYQQRFSGAIGKWMLDVQAYYVKKLLKKTCGSVLDIGGGHLQSSDLILNLNRELTIHASSESALERAYKLNNPKIKFLLGPFYELPSASQSFDSVLCLRQLSHITDWKKLVAELCRVAKHQIIIDYAPYASSNILYQVSFLLKKNYEKDTRKYHIFWTTELIKEFEKNNFKCSAIHKQFFMPMFIHRILKNVILSKLIEGFFRVFGLTYLFGSPVIAEFTREISD